MQLEFINPVNNYSAVAEWMTRWADWPEECKEAKIDINRLDLSSRETKRKFWFKISSREKVCICVCVYVCMCVCVYVRVPIRNS